MTTTTRAGSSRAGSPEPRDFMNLDVLLSDEERATREEIRSFVGERIKPNVAQWWEEAVFPREIVPEMGEKGLLGMHLSGYGCAGKSAVEYGLACMELEAGDSGLRTFVSVQGSLAMSAIHKFGSEEQKNEWLPRMAKGEAIGCFGLTEPEAGSDPASMKTFARKEGSEWVLNGRKRSMRASIQCELFLEEVRLPEGAMLPEAEGLKGPFACLNEARYGIVWGAMGAARDCFECALEYSKGREQFGKPVAGFQLTQKKLVDMMVEINKGTLLALHIGRMKDEGILRPEQVSVGKLNNVREAIEIAREARTILGGNGVTLDYPVIRHANNLESVLTYEGTNEVHTLILGNALTGVPAFR